MMGGLRRAALLSVLTAVLGCSARPTLPPPAAMPMEQRMAPVNIDIYAGDYASLETVELVRFVEDAIVMSGRFADVQTGRERWPLTLYVAFDPGRNNPGVAEFLGLMLSAATLLLIPAPIHEEHYFDFKVFAGPRLLAHYAFREEVRTALSLFHQPVEDRKAAALSAVTKFLDALERDGVVPKVGDLPQSILPEPPGQV